MIDQAQHNKLRNNPKQLLIFSIFLLLSGIALILRGALPNENAPVEDFRLEPTAVAQAMLDLQGMGYPGPEPTQPLQPGDPTHPPLQALREALKWSPNGSSVSYVLYNGSTVYVGFQMWNSFTCDYLCNAPNQVRGILASLSKTGVDYKRVVVKGAVSYDYIPDGSEPLSLTYNGDVVRSIDWMALLPDKNVYDLAENKRVGSPLRQGCFCRHTPILTVRIGKTQPPCLP